MSDDIEERLRALRPAEPPPALIREWLATEPPAPGKVRWLRFALPLSAAAALVLAFVFHREVGLPTANPSSINPSDFGVFLPVELTSTLIEARDVAVVESDPARPYRLVRRTWLDDITYAGDDGRSTLHRREPRSEIIPVALETF